MQEVPECVAAQTEQLAGRLLLTRYNGWLYVFDSVSADLTIDSRMPEDRPGHKCEARIQPGCVWVNNILSAASRRVSGFAVADVHVAVRPAAQGP